MVSGCDGFRSAYIFRRASRGRTRSLYWSGERPFPSVDDRRTRHLSTFRVLFVGESIRSIVDACNAVNKLKPINPGLVAAINFPG